MSQWITGPRGGKFKFTRDGKKTYESREARGLAKKVQRSRNGKSSARHWQLHLNSNTKFCGPAGGAARTSFPVNTEKRCRAALSYARFAKRPCGIVSCALKEATKRGWKCGTSSAGAKKCGCNKKGKCSRR